MMDVSDFYGTLCLTAVFTKARQPLAFPEANPIHNSQPISLAPIPILISGSKSKDRTKLDDRDRDGRREEFRVARSEQTEKRDKSTYVWTCHNMGPDSRFTEPRSKLVRF
jgi:hypothetical protein